MLLTESIIFLTAVNIFSFIILVFRTSILFLGAESHLEHPINLKINLTCVVRSKDFQLKVDEGSKSNGKAGNWKRRGPPFC